ncbi:unconventional myosin-XVIIIb isoform X1 [Anolis sagrei]|uniref:unconventional myosin-XVIIIb isoform X1 n=1 Tax=Anolis sagrei TaxID=38937 RepID=UPI00352258DE
MAISSRLALWEQKIKEEDRTPPPTSPPPIFSVIPGGFIKQLVRETEKEAKLKEKIPLNSKEDPPGKVDDGSVIKDTTNLWEAGQGMANSKGQGSLVQGWLNGEGEGMTKIPEKKRGADLRVGSPSSPSNPSPLPRTLFSPEGGKKDPEKVPEAGKKAHHPTPWSKQRLEGLGKENVKTRVKDECVTGRTSLRANKGMNKEKAMGEMGKKTGENKEKMGEIIGKKPWENKEKMTEETGGKVGENKEKITGKMGGNNEKMTEETGGKVGGNKEKITGETGRKVGEKKEKLVGETEKKMGETKEKTREITGKKLWENEEKMTGEKGKKVGENKEKRMGEMGKKVGENKEKTAKKVIKNKEEMRGKVEENKEKTRVITGEKQGEKIMGETGGKVMESKERIGENTEKIKDIGEKREQKSSIEETGENEENKVDLGEITDSSEKEDVWYETEKVWLVQKNGFTLATELKPDVGTPELPPGMVRVRIESDSSVLEVDEEQIQKTNPSRFDYAEDLASLVSLNESSAINTLVHRFRSQLVYTYSGPDLIAIEPWSSTNNTSKKAFKGKRDVMSPHIFSVAQKAYWTMLTQRQDQTIIPLGRSGSGKTTCCQNVLEYLVEHAGSVDNRVTVEKIQAMFTILQAFGAVSDGRNEASTRFSMAMALDFNAAGHITAAHLQTMLLERIRVTQQPDGESNFNVFTQMLAGLDLDQRTLLHLHHMRDSNSFGIRPPSTAEERQSYKASFSGLQSAFRTMGIGVQEESALCRVLAAIIHLGAAGATKVGRKQFLRWEAANEAAEALGCDSEELSSAVFKHHLRNIIQQATRNIAEEPTESPKLTGVECLEGMAAGLYEELFAAIVSLINRSFSSTLLSMASVLVLDLPGFRNPRHDRKERAASFEEFCRNYAQERLQALFYERTFTSTMERYQEEGIEPCFELPGSTPSATVALVDQRPSQVSMASAGKGDDPPKGLLWILEEEALLPGLSDSSAIQRLFSAFNTQEGTGFFLRKCEQALQFEVGHLLGHDPVRYDATGWVSKAKWNLSAENAAQVLQQSKIEAINELFQSRCKIPLVCRSVAGLEGNSQQALQRIGCVRKSFASSFAAVKKKSVCAQIKLQLDALCNLVRRSQIHFVHCLLPRTEVETHPDPTTSWDIPSLRVQLSGCQIMDALRLHRIGYSDRMALTQFRRRFQILAQPLMRKYTSAYETTDEKKALEELLRALDLEKKSIALGRTQVFLKAGLLSRLEKQRDKMVSQNLSLFQAACKGFLSRQNYRKLKVQRLAIQCIQRNLLSFQRVKAWSWWVLMGRLRPLLTSSLSADQLQAKEEELSILKKKLENAELHRQNVELLETKVIDLTAELLDERLKVEAACRVLDAERSERLKGSREVKELQNKHEDLRKKLEAAEKQLEETQQQLELREMAAKSSGKAGEEWQMHLDCAETEIGFLRKRIALLEERLETEQKAKKEIEEKLCGAQLAWEAARRSSQQFQRKCQRLACDLEDTRLLVENQQNRSHELEKRQKKFDLQLAQALGESAFEKSLREKVMQENTNLQYQVGKMQKNFEEKESEKNVLVKRLELLTKQMSELCCLSNGLDPNKMAALQKQVWDLEESAAKQEEELGLQAKRIEHLEQLHLHLELEIERKQHLHQKKMEDKEEEMDDLRGACQKKLRQLEMQCEQEAEEKQRLLAEKRDLEGLIATLCEQVGHHDFEVEKRLRRDLKRSRALLADAQLLLQESSSRSETGSTEVKAEVEKLRRQWEESVSRCAEAQEFQKEMTFELEGLRSEVEKLTRNKILMDEQLYQLQHEKADLLKRIDEDQEDLNDLMEKHKALIAQSAKDISQIQDLQTQLEDLKKEKQNIQEKLQALESRLKGHWSQGSSPERSIVSRQEALIREQENKAAFQDVQVKRLEMLVLRLRDSLIRLGEETERGKESERREKENAEYAWKRMEEMKAQLQELQDRENQAQHKRVQMEKQIDELSAVRQTLQADLETAIRRIADLQAALEEVRSSDEDESDTESVHTAKESLTSRMDTESVGSSSISLNLGPEGSVYSWRSAPSPTWSDLSKDLERRSVSGIGTEKNGANMQREGGELCKLPRSASSFALSEYVEELRRKRLNEEELGDSGPNLPIYQTTGASILRRSRPMQENDESCKSLARDVQNVKSEVATSLQQKPWKSSLEEMRELEKPMFGSCKTLVQNVQSEAAASLQAKPWRSSMEEIRELEKPKPALKFGLCESLMRDVQNEVATSSQVKPWRSSLEEIRELQNPVYGPCKPLVQNESAASLQMKPWRSSLEEIRELENPKFTSCKPLVQGVQNETATSLQAKPWKSSLEEMRELEKPIYGSCKPLVQNVQSETAASLQAKPWKSSLEEIRELENPIFNPCKSLVRGEEMGELVGMKPLVFQSRRFGREAEDQDNFPPAIRTSRSPRRDGQRPMSVHFEDEVKAVLGPKGNTILGPDDDDDSSSSSSSSGSVVSFKGRQPEGQAPRADHRLEAEGKEDDVHSIMRKYLGKE